jgi:hypothetical protein
VLATYTFTNNILTALDNKLLVEGLFCDLAKAFNCVKHDKLLKKMEYYGINGKEGDPIKSYLMTYQRVIINMNTPKIVVNGKKLNSVYHKVQYSVHCFYYNTLMIYHM